MEKDKILHYGVCFAITIIGTTLLEFIGVDAGRAIAISSLVAFMCGIGKECYDKYIGRTGFDGMDIVADLCGIITAVFAAVLT